MEQKTMKALVYHEPGKISLDEVDVPVIKQPKDVIGKVTINAICTSDVHVMHGYLPMATPPLILGHEFCVEAIEAGSEAKDIQGNDIVIGKHYCVLPASFCGECDFCKAGNIAGCVNGGTYGVMQNGCQAEYVRIPDSHSGMLPIPEGMTDKQIVLLGDMLATAWFGIENANVEEGQTIAVVGLGPVGMCACELLTNYFGCKVVGLTRSQEKLDLALKQGVIVAGISPATDDVAARVAELTEGKGFSAVIETPGNQSSMDLACSVVGYQGIVSTIAIFGSAITIPMNALCYKNATIKMGVQQLHGIAEMLEAIMTGKISTEWMLTHSSSLDEIVKGYEVFGGSDTPDCIKWVIEA